MQPLYNTITTITFEEYKKLNKAAKTEQNKLALLMYPVLLFMALTSKSWWLALFTILLFIFSQLLSIYLIKKEYHTNKSLQQQKINYEFYDTFFLTEIAGVVTKVYYNELNLIKETKSNFYLSRAKKNIYVIIKANCSSDLISFLQNSELLHIPVKQEPLSEEHTSYINCDCAVPLYEATTLFNAQEQNKLKQYVVNKELKLPYLFIPVFLIMIAVIIFSKNFFWLIPILAIAVGLFIGLWSNKGNNPFMQVEEPLLRYRFYNNYVQLETPLDITNYNYTDLYDVLETETNFYLKISSRQYIILVKENCSTELMEYIRNLSSFIYQQPIKK